MTTVMNYWMRFAVDGRLCVVPWKHRFTFDVAIDDLLQQSALQR